MNLEIELLSWNSVVLVPVVAAEDELELVLLDEVPALLFEELLEHVWRDVAHCVLINKVENVVSIDFGCLNQVGVEGRGASVDWQQVFEFWLPAMLLRIEF